MRQATAESPICVRSFVPKLGRGHVHYVPYSHTSPDACTYAAKDGSRHSTMTLASNSTQAMDEVLHNTYGRRWGGTIRSRARAQGAWLVPVRVPEHKEGNGCKSHCVLGAWHEPQVKTLKSTQSLAQSHVFNCQHLAAKGLHHHVFVLGASGSMAGEPWEALTTATLRSFARREATAAPTLSRKPLVDMTDISLPFSGRTTNYDDGLRVANDVLSRNDHKTYTPVLLFF
ncbi:hypothetical protein SDRG_04108 [Saprolegnia diclina VS20]|uniref:Uncharacterized protein n=1 Tax=Saprolegnia diclina (strain VS20) TaxID=1156394 RepID=T0S6L4_SAPDV|nr:hypothetical protein SDRG_04108 [Saprolegnia diclina VS20]EQC38397.1 hypothetical protein SDRG_04108 [Saprolegnia diclina VS20]|eukprot:XP_008607989.1 hypothetical protein SDRG_04108 [Saprolegnia diclina VS20]